MLQHVAWIMGISATDRPRASLSILNPSRRQPRPCSSSYSAECTPGRSGRTVPVSSMLSPLIVRASSLVERALEAQPPSRHSPADEEVPSRQSEDRQFAAQAHGPEDLG